MRLLGVGTYTVTRYAAGDWSSGRFVPGAPTTFDVLASVQPLDPRTLEQLPEGARTRARKSMYANLDQPVLATSKLADQTSADRMEYEGRNYVVERVGDWTDHDTGIPHHEYVLLEVGEDE